MCVCVPCRLSWLIWLTVVVLLAVEMVLNKRRACQCTTHAAASGAQQFDAVGGIYTKKSEAVAPAPASPPAVVATPPVSFGAAVASDLESGGEGKKVPKKGTGGDIEMQA